MRHSGRDEQRARDLQAVRQAYDRYASAGHDRRWDHANPGEAMLSAQAQVQIIERVARALPRGRGRVLDLGCGDGSLAGVARDRGLEVEWTGVDLRDAAVRSASEAYPWATFETASADALPFAADSFDVVVSAVLFSSLPSRDLERAVAAEIGRVLRPGGTLVWYDMRYPNPGNRAVHHLPRARVRSLFRGWAGRLESVTLIPPLARRLGPATSVLYPLLHRMPVLRSHLVGTFRKPMKVGPRLLLVTGLWPTPDMPSAGSFVRDRVGDDPSIRVVSPRRYDIPMPVRYLRLLWDALTARGRFDGVEAHVLFPTGVIGLLAAKLRGIPLVVYVHGHEVRHAVHQNALYNWLARLVTRHAAAIVVNSTDTAERTAELGGTPPVVIPPGIEIARFGPTPRPAARRVLYVGGDRVEKGPEVARELADTLIGHYLDERDPDEIPSLMASHDVLLMPSHEEPYGLAAAEAIASGRWVVARAVGGLVDIITDGVNGTLVRDGDFARALAEVPDYDPESVAATAARFDVAQHRVGLTKLWIRLRRP